MHVIGINISNIHLATVFLKLSALFCFVASYIRILSEQYCE